MRDLTEAEVKAIVQAAGIPVLESDIAELTLRYNGWMEVMRALEALPLQGVLPIPTPLTQRGGA